MRSLLAPLAVACVALPGAAHGKVFLTVDEALKLAFPGCSVERRTVYLTEEQVASVTRLADEGPVGALVHPYRATCGGQPGGTAYFDVHRVRTLSETVMVLVGVDGAVRRVEVLAFNEPEDYLPKAAWYGQFVGKRLTDELALKQSIRPISGATLTARATMGAVRRVLALHQVLSAPTGAPR